LEFLKVAMSEQQQQIYEFGPFRLDATKRVLFKENEPVKIFPKEFATLLALVERSGEVLEKEELMRTIWPDSIVEEGNLTTYISHLRKLLGESPEQHDYIVTIPGKGYRFVAGVRPVADELVIQERTKITIEAEEIEESDVQVEPATSPLVKSDAASGNRLMLIGVTLIIATVVTPLLIYKFARSRRSQAGVTPPPFAAMNVSRLTNSGKVTLATISPDGRYFVHVTEEAEGQSLWVRQVEVTTASQQIVAPKQVEYWGLTFSPDANYVYCVVWETNSGEASLYQVPVLGGTARKLPIHPDSPVSFSPDGKQMTFVNTHSASTNLMLANPDGTSVRELTRRLEPDYFGAIQNGPAWSPDGISIVVTLNTNDGDGHHTQVLSVTPANGAERVITNQRWWGVRNLAWLRDGSGLLATVYDQPSAPAQVWHISYPDAVARRITNDVNQYDGISLTKDTRAFITVQTSIISGVWVAPLVPANTNGSERLVSDSDAKQLTSEVGEVSDLTWATDEKIVYVSRASGTANVWSISAADSKATQLTTDARVNKGIAVSPDGSYIVFASDRSGTINLWRADHDGSNQKQLTTGNGDIFPNFSPDGRWIVFQRGSGLVTPTLWRVSIDGGEAVRVTEGRAQKPRVSPDGNFVAYFYLDSQVASESHWAMEVVRFAGGQPLKTFNFPPMVSARIVRWTPDGKGLAYLERHDGISNIWIQPLGGGRARQLTNFKTLQITSFDWSHDGSQLVLVREARISDVVLVSSQ
jgi:Tol biopolymer transport system component/DNA-binding winged helix-turn-helix (wHTH) protein